MGTNLLPVIFAILLRFRLQVAAIISVITQAFLQLSLDVVAYHFSIAVLRIAGVSYGRSMARIVT